MYLSVSLGPVWSHRGVRADVGTAERGKAHVVIQYRTFQNPDPPGLVAVWNNCFTGRASVPLRVTALLEYFTLAKPYFDPAGLILAEENGTILGFAHSGFACTPDGTALDHSRGIITNIGVLPAARKHGIGTELLKRSEEYLRTSGSKELFAGPQAPWNPFTFGLYGGASSPGFLDSDTQARAFFEKHGYRAEEPCLVLQRSLERVQIAADSRFVNFRTRFEIHAAPYHAHTWWKECVFGPIDVVEYRLVEKGTNQLQARALLWELDTYNSVWNEHAVGMLDVETQPALRRQGLAKFLLAQILRHLQEQFFSLIEVQVATTNAPALALLQNLGFSQVDVGYRYRRV
jgi:ribosomal protein S18 acetylase RimI-like enzyme